MNTRKRPVKKAKHNNPVQNKNRQWLQDNRFCQVVSIDIVGLFTLTPRRNTGILVLSVYFTGWRDALPMPNAKF